MVGPKIYKQNKTSYRVWDHQIEDCWDGYGKKVRVIVSEELFYVNVYFKKY